MRKHVDKPCEGCGALMIDVPEKRRFCDACRLARNAENSARWRAQQALAAGRAPKLREGRHAAAPRAPVPQDLTLDYVAMQATNEGISYGAYSVRHGLYKKNTSDGGANGIRGKGGLAAPLPGQPAARTGAGAGDRAAAH